jgi:phosphatidylserine/phosphatidylglycerophosphate/cardiolipin synthase-like enzyme
VFTCFEAKSDVLRVNEIRVGDTSLLGQFMDLCSIYDEGRVFFTAPFYDGDFIEKLGTHLPMAFTDFEVIVKNVDAAEEMVQCLLQQGCRTVQVYISEHIHAKVYIFESRRGDLAALIGSHNPTKAGISKNLEVGVFIGTRPHKPEWKTIVDLRDYLRGRSCFYSNSTDRKDLKRS